MPEFVRECHSVSPISDAVLSHLRNVAGTGDAAGLRYELGEEIGRGGMGVVYRAHDRELDRPVALKVLNPLPEGAGGSARLAQEARIIARLEHPGIVPIHDAGQLPDGRLFYAMKLVRGRRLDEHTNRPISLAESLRNYLKICDAVAFAHAHGVLHRDLKPQNVMFGPFGEVLVMDWGVAKAIGGFVPSTHWSSDAMSPLGRTVDGTVIGTPGYMAPEQGRGDLGTVDERADVFGLGAILYFLLTDHAPGADASQIMPPRQFDLSIPKPLEAICLRALAADRAARYSSVSELADDVTRFLGAFKVQAYRESSIEAIYRVAVRYRAALALVMAYVIMRILLLFFARG
jgi:eukaryotic-like serine/threonine-protein kinase